MATPEGKVKTKVSALLKATPDLWYNMPVPSGFGEQTLDYLGCHRGAFFAVETKAPGSEPTPRQERTIEKMRLSGAKVFIIDSNLEELALWLKRSNP